MSAYKPKEYKIIVIDNAGFHSMKNEVLPDNIHLINIPPYSPELNPCEKIWQYIKERFKNKNFKNMKTLRSWLHKQVENMSDNTIKSITHNKAYLEAFNSAFYT